MSFIILRLATPCVVNSSRVRHAAFTVCNFCVYKFPFLLFFFKFLKLLRVINSKLRRLQDILFQDRCVLKQPHCSVASYQDFCLMITAKLQSLIQLWQDYENSRWRISQAILFTTQFIIHSSLWFIIHTPFTVWYKHTSHNCTKQKFAGAV